ncbi:DUF4430 domain-containing protein [Enterococcus sp. 5H]|uniref:DUF4430 domain-containing protein n=1 Tax=Enterococcus sp. 5H TaxID=1229490 RepID=UPI00230379C3|nr:DUF4430 domain-containing protein [Enterococcus sp. 5H]MDA9470089.1 hypothetical protein [Enterococcus sp. 5H]
MKKLINATMVLVLIFFLAACGKTGDSQKTNEQTNQNVTIILKEDGKQFDKKEIKFQPKESLQTIMDANFKLDMDKDFISGIDGHKQDAATSKYWLYDVNGKQPDVGAVEYFPKDGDVVTWTLDKI